MSSPQGLNLELGRWQNVWKVPVKAVKEGGGVCKVVTIALLATTIPVVFVITVQGYFAKSVEPYDALMC